MLLRRIALVSVVIGSACGRADHPLAPALEHGPADAIITLSAPVALPASLEILHRYTHVPALHVKIPDVDALHAVLALDGVAAVSEDTRHSPSLAQSLPLIRAPEAHASGARGAGSTVAVLDTGVDDTHPSFGARVIQAPDIARDDGVLDDDGHGTNVAGIVLGVAPDARVAALDVFRDDGFAYVSDILAGIDWVIDHRAEYNITAANLSLGYGLFSTYCEGEAMEPGILALRAAGIVPVVASGNDGATDAISSPACIRGALSVGAVYEQAFAGVHWSNCTDAPAVVDGVTCFSNSAPILGILAPGAIIDAGGLQMGGTSQAAPHVAGAVAVLASKFPAWSIDTLTNRLVTTGRRITDARTGQVFPRLDVMAALDVSGEAPRGTLRLLPGPQYTRTPSVQAMTVVLGGGPATSMCISVGGTCTSWVPFSAAQPITLPSTDGLHTVTTRLRNAAGLESAPISATILLDSTPPVDGAIALQQYRGFRRLVVSGFSDGGSGISRYRIVGSATPVGARCEGGTWSAESTGPSLPLFARARYHRVCAIDRAGNVSAGVDVPPSKIL